MEDTVIKGQIFKGVAGAYQVFANNQIFDNISARKKLRYKSLYVGDYVEFDEQQRVVEDVFERKNSIIRPPLANIDKMFVVVAPKPEPDLLLVDKLIIQSMQNNIAPYLVINKMDIVENKMVDEIKQQYSTVLPILTTSANDAKTLKDLKKELKNSLSIFVGQSAVGKSSLLNALLPNAKREVGQLSQKTSRGKNCTRESQIYLFDDDAKIADTTGFSSLELKTITKEQLTDFFVDIKQFSAKCEYNTCNHFGEDESICAVKRAVKDGLINKHRYERYVLLFKQLKEWEKKKYG